ncbi:hypothetical protein DFH07DRAFT_1063336 [Mycena maculata]|uniref:Uncharacterized protein n=1 Tax=Mycena maculata TaxID=230809 RepID=A0AAD7ILB1_9AGAR|nr:hypothetical protein DFH07DRAFT_1063336 [Mycena maculata]
MYLTCSAHCLCLLKPRLPPSYFFVSSSDRVHADRHVFSAPLHHLRTPDQTCSVDHSPPCPPPSTRPRLSPAAGVHADSSSAGEQRRHGVRARAAAAADTRGGARSTSAVGPPTLHESTVPPAPYNFDAPASLPSAYASGTTGRTRTPSAASGSRSPLWDMAWTTPPSRPSGSSATRGVWVRTALSHNVSTASMSASSPSKKYSAGRGSKTGLLDEAATRTRSEWPRHSNLPLAPLLDSKRRQRARPAGFYAQASASSAGLGYAWCTHRTPLVLRVAHLTLPTFLAFVRVELPIQRERDEEAWWALSGGGRKEDERCEVGCTVRRVRNGWGPVPAALPRGAHHDPHHAPAPAPLDARRRLPRVQRGRASPSAPTGRCTSPAALAVCRAMNGNVPSRARKTTRGSAGMIESSSIA